VNLKARKTSKIRQSNIKQKHKQSFDVHNKSDVNYMREKRRKTKGENKIKHTTMNKNESEH